MISIITGRRGIGKTTYVLKMIEEIRTNGNKSSGIITPAIYDEDSNKVGFYALDLTNGDQWELGRSDKDLNGHSYGPFSFSERGFIRANEILKCALTKGSEDVFLDEIGPMELIRGYGFYPVLSLITSFNKDRDLYLVIRPELIKKFTNIFLPGKEYKVVEITNENRDSF